MENKWISVKDKSPEPMTSVMVWVQGFLEPIKHFYTGRRYLNAEKLIMPKYYVIEYWQPLPAPPSK